MLEGILHCVGNMVPTHVHTCKALWRIFAEFVRIISTLLKAETEEDNGSTMILAM